jgi:hypothetical protein
VSHSRADRHAVRGEVRELLLPNQIPLHKDDPAFSFTLLRANSQYVRSLYSTEYSYFRSELPARMA